MFRSAVGVFARAALPAVGHISARVEPTAQRLVSTKASTPGSTFSFKLSIMPQNGPTTVVEFSSDGAQPQLSTERPAEESTQLAATEDGKGEPVLIELENKNWCTTPGTKLDGRATAGAALVRGLSHKQLAVSSPAPSATELEAVS